MRQCIIFRCMLNNAIQCNAAMRVLHIIVWNCIVLYRTVDRMRNVPMELEAQDRPQADSMMYRNFPWTHHQTINTNIKYMMIMIVMTM